MARPTFKPIYEESEQVIKDRMLERIPDEWRKEEGDFIHDSVAASPLEIKDLQANQDNILKNAFASTAEGISLDYKLAEVGLTRIQASFNQRQLDVTADEGVKIPAGYTASTVILDDGGEPIEFTTDQEYVFAASGETLTIDLTCKEAGTVGNVADGSEFILLPPIPGVRTITGVGTTIPGADEETDLDAWERFSFKVTNPDTGGNKNDYIRWTQDVTGVGKAECIPRWDGVNTVKVVIVNTEMQPASTTLTDETQDYLDPGSGGLGEGKAPMGAVVTVVAATALPIDVTATVTYESGADQTQVKEDFSKALEEYLETLVFTGYVVSYAKVGALLVTTPGVVNYADLTVNGLTDDVVVGDEEVAIEGTITI